MDTLDSPQPSDAPPTLPDRYRLRRCLGRGGMGEVWRVYDAQMGRTVALKVIHASLVGTEGVDDLLERFAREARLTARLQHPGVLPVYDLGELPMDGRPYFTMREVAGQNLQERVAASFAGQAPAGWDTRRLVAALARAADALGHAHGLGVLHRDIKPANLLIGPFGEVLVGDWGIACAGEGSDPALELPPAGALTVAGARPGTPGFLAPELRAGAPPSLATEVWALGASLHVVLYGSPPGQQPLRSAAPPPPDLQAIAEEALSKDPRARMADAAAFAARLRGWLDGSLRRGRAVALVEAARSARQRAADAQDLAAQIRRARQEHAGQATLETVEERRTRWASEDAEQSATLDSRRYQAEGQRLLQEALEQDAELPAARALAAQDALDALRAAEAAMNTPVADLAEASLAREDRGALAVWLRREGRLSLVTDRPAQVRLARFEEVDRALVPVDLEDLGETPVVEQVLPMGSYLLTLSAPGCVDVRYPVWITRNAHWDGRSPAGEVVPIHLPAEGSLGPDEVYVPAGWFLAGDPAGTAAGALPWGPRWADAFAIRRFPVTVGAYLEFLQEIYDGEGLEAMLVHAPRLQGLPAALASTVVEVGPGGRLGLHPDADGDDWLLDWPIFLVSGVDATAFAAWEARRRGQAWRLPRREEREKATRGVDGRTWPWGTRFDGTRCHLLHASSTGGAPAVVGRAAGDRSVYGMADGAGGICDIVLGEGGEQLIVGGAWSVAALLARSSVAFPHGAEARQVQAGLRLARSLQGV